MSTRAQDSGPAEAPAQGPAGAGGSVRLKRALISVSDKTGLVDFARGLTELGVELISTGGTARVLSEAGLEVTSVEEVTGSPEILGGRVKTLHPAIHAALLADRDDPEHVATLEREGIEPIELVCVNLYPFERAVARLDVDEDEAIENIDIGGPTIIRAAAKNHRHVTVVVGPEAYDALLAELEESGGEISAPTRHWHANEAFAYTARYDAHVSRWFSGRYESFPGQMVTAWEKFLDLSYGENPHQRAALYTEVGSRSHVLSRVAKLHGKPLSFNNVLDLDAARALLADLEGPACVIVKHNNPCGAAVASTAEEAFDLALECDPQSAFGGVIALDRPVDGALARRIDSIFVEALCASGYEDDALEVLERKEAIRILEDTERRTADPAARDLKRVRGGLLVQDTDRGADPTGEMEVVTSAEPTEAQWADLRFAWTLCKHVRSNAIVLARGGATIGIGAGQMSRVDSVRLALEKARDARGEAAEAALRGAVLASDAFFPFPDGPQVAIDAGIQAIIQPGGSKRDPEVIAAAEQAGVAMVLTHRRHFRH